MASFWHEKILGYLSLDIVFLKAHSFPCALLLENTQHFFGKPFLKTVVCTGFYFSVRFIGSKKEIIWV